MTGTSPTPRDAVQIAQNAAQRLTKLEEIVDELQTENDALQTRVDALELELEQLHDDRAYSALSLDEKVGRVRRRAYERAADLGGGATLDYTDIMHGVFDGEPGAAHCYKLIRLAAGLTDSSEGRPTGSGYPGFRARDPDQGNYHLAVDVEKVDPSARRSFSREKTEPDTDPNS